MVIGEGISDNKNTQKEVRNSIPDILSCWCLDKYLRVCVMRKEQRIPACIHWKVAWKT